MSFTLTILGTSSALPTATTNPTSHFLNVNEQYFLIDCGEGTQMQLRKNRIKIQRIRHIFISHLHGDHYFGLIGLITTMQLLGREKELNIFSPDSDLLKQIIELQLGVHNHGQALDFPVIFHQIDSKNSEIIFENEKLTVQTIPLKHRIPCSGFLFREKQKSQNIKKDMIGKHEISIEQIQQLKLGSDLRKSDGSVVKNEELTLAPPLPCSYAFCSDTKYDEAIIPIIRNVDLLYHEATFLNELENQAKRTAHSTALQAATIAKMANVKQLIIGHFSARYKNPEVLLNEAKTIFENTILAEEGKKYKVEK